MGTPHDGEIVRQRENIGDPMGSHRVGTGQVTGYDGYDILYLDVSRTNTPDYTPGLDTLCCSCDGGIVLWSQSCSSQEAVQNTQKLSASLTSQCCFFGHVLYNDNDSCEFGRQAYNTVCLLANASLNLHIWECTSVYLSRG